MTHSPEVQTLMQRGKVFHGSKLSAPILVPHVKAHCVQCEQATGTAFKLTKAGIGNACSRCGKFRKGKPYVSKREFESLTRHNDAKGGNHGSKRTVV